MRERHAARDAARARRDVSASEDDLVALEADHASAEHEVLAGAPSLSGSTVSLLELGRRGHTRARTQAQRTLERQSELLDDRRAAHQQSLYSRRGKEAVLEAVRREERDAIERDAQRELDDRTSSTHGSDD